MSKDEALKLALDALLEVKSWKSPTRWDGCFDKEITAIKKALSSCQCPECRVALHASDCAVHNEPAYPNGECNCGVQRTWAGLTEAQCGVLWKTNMTPFEYYQDIEAKLKEKNT